MMPRITPLVKNLIIINILLFVIVRFNLLPIIPNLDKYFTLYSIDTGKFEPYQLFTHMFMHSDVSLRHIMFNMLALFFIGPIVESVLKPNRFLFLYISAGLAGGLAGAFLTENTASTGASAAINGIFMAFALMFPNMKMMIFPLPFEVKAIFLVMAYFTYDLFSGLSRLDTGIGHFAHLAGAIVGGILILSWKLTRLR